MQIGAGKAAAAGGTIGISFSFWKQTPLTGAVFGIVAWVAAQIGAYPVALRVMVVWQRGAVSTKVEFAGFAIQLGLGKITPTIGGIVTITKVKRAKGLIAARTA